MKVQWTRLALRRADEAAAYIARDSESAAGRWLSGLQDAVRRLERFPQSGRVAEDLDRSDLREIQYGSYRVVYRVEPGFVRILTVRHLRRAPDPDELDDL
jgi:plasmid stabilization system protein ParE